jgi:hypothetical protein
MHGSQMVMYPVRIFVAKTFTHLFTILNETDIESHWHLAEHRYLALGLSRH